MELPLLIISGRFMEVPILPYLTRMFLPVVADRLSPPLLKYSLLLASYGLLQRFISAKLERVAYWWRSSLLLGARRSLLLKPSDYSNLSLKCSFLGGMRVVRMLKASSFSLLAMTPSRSDCSPLSQKPLYCSSPSESYS